MCVACTWFFFMAVGAACGAVHGCRCADAALPIRTLCFELYDAGVMCGVYFGAFRMVHGIVITTNSCEEKKASDVKGLCRKPV